MNLVQVKNNEITLRHVPENYTHEDGSVTLGYNLLPIEELSRDGWVEVVEVKPTYNPETQYLSLESEVVGVNKVTATYKVVDIIPYKPVVTEEQKAIDMMKYLMNNDQFLTTVGIAPKPTGV